MIVIHDEHTKFLKKEEIFNSWGQWAHRRPNKHSYYMMLCPILNRTSLGDYEMNEQEKDKSQDFLKNWVDYRKQMWLPATVVCEHKLAFV